MQTRSASLPRQPTKEKPRICGAASEVGGTGLEPVTLACRVRLTADRNRRGATNALAQCDRTIRRATQFAWFGLKTLARLLTRKRRRSVTSRRAHQSIRSYAQSRSVRALSAAALAEIGWQERGHHAVPAPVVLRRHQAAKDALAGEAGAFSDTLRRDVFWCCCQLKPLHAQLVECPSSARANAARPDGSVDSVARVADTDADTAGRA
jgi:hypothetical protein